LVTEIGDFKRARLRNGGVKCCVVAYGRQIGYRGGYAGA
jgi:hypothetical protein